MQQADFFTHETAIIDDPSCIGAGSKVWHFCHIMRDCEIGENCSLGQNVFISSGVRLGRNVKVQNNVSIYAGVICEDDVFLGPSMVFTNVTNPRSAIIRKSEYKETYLERGVSIGANAVLVCGIRLGRYAFVGAGAVLTRDLPAYALALGNPARQVGWMSEYGHKLEFGADHTAQCPESGQKYILESGIVREITHT